MGELSFQNSSDGITLSETMRLDKDGNVGIGTAAPSATLDVEGTLQYIDGNEGATKVLTSDASGNATWQTAAADGDGDSSNEIQTLSISGSDITLSGGGTVSIPDGAFKTTSNVTSNTPGTLGTDDFVFGSTQLDDDGAAHDSRMFFDKSNGAFQGRYCKRYGME